MVGDTTAWLNIIGLVTSIAVSVGVILAAVRKWFQRMLKEAVNEQTATIAAQLDQHQANDDIHFAEIRAILNKKVP